jgi:hypothetical protein
MVGFALVDHTTPLEVTAAPPSELIFPPEMAEFDIIALNCVVFNDGLTTFVVVLESLRQRTEIPTCRLGKFILLFVYTSALYQPRKVNHALLSSTLDALQKYP